MSGLLLALLLVVAVALYIKMEIDASKWRNESLKQTKLSESKVLNDKRQYHKYEE